jgi:hypothetical protein
MKVYNGSAWLDAYASLSGALIATNNLSDLNNTATARTNLGLGTGNSPTFTALNVGAGTVSAPAITTTGDTNTGIFFPAADTIAFTEGGVESMRIDSAGNLGLGTTSPFTKLEVRDGVSTTFTNNPVNLVLSNNGTIAAGLGAGIAFSANFDGSSLTTYAAISGIRENATSGSPLGALVLGTRRASGAAMEAMRITSAGNVGIGTTAPTTNLEVSSTGDTIVTINAANNNDSKLVFSEAGSAEYSIIMDGLSGSTQSLQFYNNRTATEAMRITSTGLVGIGNSSPTYQLDVLTSGNNGIRVAAGTASADQLFMGNTGGLPAFGTLTNQVVRFITNGSERARIDTSGNLGLGVTPSAWGATYKALDINTVGGIASTTGGLRILANAYFSGSAWTYKTTAEATRYDQVTGQHQFYTAPSGTAGTAVTFTQAMTLDASGNLGIGLTSPSSKLDVSGLAKANAFGMNATGGSPATGMAAPASDTLALYTNTVERMRIDSAGNVGIGTSSPGVKLEVSGIMGARRNGGGYILQFLNSSSDSSLSGFIYDNNQDNIEITAFDPSYALAFKTNNIERMRISSTGNVGIGTTSPTYKLQINVSAGANALNITDASTSDFQIKPGVSSGIVRVGPSAGGMALYTNDTERMRIDSSGNVGIGTTSPGYKFQISGVGTGVTSRMGITNTTTGSTLEVGSDGNGGFLATSGSYGTLFYTNGTERMRITAAGQLRTAVGGTTMMDDYGCRAWVNFNGTGTVAIRASGNVSSITDNGTGNYTVNFTTALPDANYSVVCQSSTQTSGTSEGRSSLASPRDLATSSYRQLTTSAADGSQLDAAIVNVVVLR